MALHEKSSIPGEEGEWYRTQSMYVGILGDGLIKYRDRILTRYEAEELIDCLESALRHYRQRTTEDERKADEAARERYLDTLAKLD